MKTKYFSNATDIAFAPVIPEINPLLLADPLDNTMLSSALKGDILLTIQNWGVGAPGGPFLDQMWLVHRDEGGVEEDVHAGSYDVNSSFPFDVKLDKSVLDRWGEGKHHFFVRVILYNEREPQDFPPLTLIFDRFAPYSGGFPAKFPGIETVLDTNIGNVKLTLPEYADWAAGDKVHWAWRERASFDPKDPQPDGTVLVDRLPLEIPVPRQIIEGIGDGGVIAAYTLEDKAGNFSALSHILDVVVALGELPGQTDFLKPLVNGMNNDVVDQDAVLKGIEVEVAAYQHYKATDKITILWGTHAFEERVIGTFPVKQAIPSAVILAAYGPASKGGVPVNVSYTVRRGEHPLGGEDDSFDVNLERIGPVIPDPDPWPDPVNPIMALPDVYGGTDKQKNVLTENDEGSGAELKVTIDAAFEVGDLVSFYYWTEDEKAGEDEAGHVVGADHRLTVGEPGDEISVTIPWDHIEARDNGERFAHYTVSRTGVPNKVVSDVQSIQVAAIVLRPAAATFMDGVEIGGNLWLNCTSLVAPKDPADTSPVVRIDIPDLSEWLRETDNLTLTWSVTQGLLPGGKEIPDAKYEITTPLDQDHPPAGFIWEIPYDQGLKPILEFEPGVSTDGLATFTYSFELNGKRVTSKPAEVFSAVHQFGEECPIVSP